MNVYHYTGNPSAFLSCLTKTISRRPVIVSFRNVLGVVCVGELEKRLRRIKERPDQPFSLLGDLGYALDNWGLDYPDNIKEALQSELTKNLSFIRFRLKEEVLNNLARHRIPSSCIGRDGTIQVWDCGNVQHYSASLQLTMLEGARAFNTGKGSRYSYVLVTSANPKGHQTFTENDLEKASQWAESVGINDIFLSDAPLDPQISQQIVEVGDPFVEVRKGGRDIGPVLMKFGIRLRRLP